MKIGILSREPKNYSTRRLREAGKARGHDVRVFNTLGFSIHVEEEEPSLYYKNKPMPNYDAVIPRIGASITFYGTAVVRQFEQMGVYTHNTSWAISVSRDKLRSMQMLSRHTIGIPDSAFVRAKNEVIPAIRRVGGAPVIIKLLEGTQGVGVILADTEKIAEAIIQTLQSTKQSVLVQKFVKESKGKDFRAFVVGGKVIAAMKRQAVGDEFRSNVHRGGQATQIELTEEYQKTAIHAAHIMGLRVAGVDMLEGEDGPKVLEVNSSPGLEGIETATGVDVAGEIIKDLEEQTRFPDIDLRQRLTLRAGYAVAEVPVGPKSTLKNLTIAESNLRDQHEVIVLSIERGSIVIPSPKGQEQILVGDKLLCYGKKAVLNDLVPVQKKKKKKSKKKKKTT
ncbi:MAG: 30S ribosomal protein S6--L-glutamate ligase [Phycisphaeraceae bacterium]